MIEIESDAAGDPLAFVFKTIADPYVGQISLMRVRSGTLKPDLSLTNTRSGADERLAKLATMTGKETELVDSAPAGDIVAVAKLNDRDPFAGDDEEAEGISVAVGGGAGLVALPENLPFMREEGGGPNPAAQTLDGELIDR